MLLTTVQCIGQPPTKKNRLAQNISSAEAEKFCSKCRLNGPSSRRAAITRVCSPLTRLPKQVLAWTSHRPSTGGLGRTGGNLKHKHFSLQVLGSQERALSSNR